MKRSELFGTAWQQSYQNGYNDPLIKHAGKTRADLRAEIKQHNESLKDNTRKLRDLKSEEARLRAVQSGFEAVCDLPETGEWPLQPIAASRVSDFLTAVRDGLAGSMYERDGQHFLLLNFNETKAAFSTSEIFLLDRNYAALIKNKEELISSEWRLPYNSCCFECRFINRRDVFHVICHVSDNAAKEYVFFLNAARNGDGCWMASAIHDESGDVIPIEGCDLKSVPFAKFVVGEVKAVCVLIDAEAVNKEQQRVPHRLNESRARRNKLPLYDFHTLSLRRAVSSMGSDFEKEERNSPRLHLRRGHWRHFATFKTWVRWAVVGDPSKGYIDKIYRA